MSYHYEDVDRKTGKSRSQLRRELYEKHPHKSKILLELTVVSTGVCDPFPTEYIVCRTKSGQDVLVKPHDVVYQEVEGIEIKLAIAMEETNDNE